MRHGPIKEEINKRLFRLKEKFFNASELKQDHKLVDEILDLYKTMIKHQNINKLAEKVTEFTQKASFLNPEKKQKKIVKC
jgi:hypothetical protein